MPCARASTETKARVSVVDDGSRDEYEWEFDAKAKPAF